MGHPKSGNTWLAYMLALLLLEDRDREVNLLNVGEFVPFVHGRDHEIAKYDHLPDPRVFRNEYPLHQGLYPRIVYIVRDPRSVLVSFWHMYRVMFADEETSLPAFVDQYMSGSGCFTYWNKHLVRWDRQVRPAIAEARETERLHLVRYEDLVRDRREVLEGVVRFLDLPAEESQIIRAVELGSFEAMRDVEDRFGSEAYEGRARGSGRFVRSGEVDSWKREIDQATLARIQQALGRAMHEAGYV